MPYGAWLPGDSPCAVNELASAVEGHRGQFRSTENCARYSTGPINAHTQFRRAAALCMSPPSRVPRVHTALDLIVTVGSVGVSIRSAVR